MSYTVDGLVLRIKKTGENDKLLTLLTPNEGRIYVMVKGGRSLKSGSLPATQLFAYGNYEITDRNGFKWLGGASVEHMFSGLSSSVEKVALASYFASVAEELSDENEPAEDILRLTLNAFFALENDKKPPALIKAVFELRAAAQSGFLPDIEYCRVCKCKDAKDLYLDVMNGCLLCSECMNKASLAAAKVAAKSEDIRDAIIMIPITQSIAAAMRYAISAPIQRMLAFSLKEDELSDFARAAEAYLLNHIEHGFDTLDFYKLIS